MAFPTGWTKKCALVIDADKVSGTANLTNFPVLLTEANFPSTIFDNTQSAGQDLRFTSDADGATELAFEVVTWDTTKDKAQVWVKIPTVDYDDDTTFYVWYGNSDATAYAETDTYGARNVWSNGYDIVLHMEDKDAVNDSTANQYDFTKVGTPENETGKIGGSVTFDGSTDVYYRLISDSANVNGTGSFTFSCWLNTNDYTAWQKIYTHGYDSNTKDLETMVMNTSKLVGSAYNLSNNPTTTTSVANGTWYYFTYAYDSTNNLQVVRFNATEEDNNSTAGTTRVSLANTGHGGGNTPIAIGAVWFSNAWYSQKFNGEIDELHFANDVFRTADWTATEYANQSSPATFITEGTEESIGGGTGCLFGFLGKGIIPSVRNC